MLDYSRSWLIGLMARIFILIKITKASIKDVIIPGFEVDVTFEVKNETVDQGKAGGHPDALTIEENIMKGRLIVVGGGVTRTTERLIASLNLLGGEPSSLKLFKRLLPSDCQ